MSVLHPVSLKKRPPAETPVLEGAVVSAPDPAADVEKIWYRRAVDTRPVLAPWLVARSERAAAVRWAVRYVQHETAFQAVRVPAYATRLAAWSPRGLVRSVKWWAYWCFDLEAAPVRAAVIGRGEGADHYRLTAQRNDRVRLRLQASGGILAVATTVGGVSWFVWPWTRWAFLFTLLVVLGYIGRPLDKPFVEHATITGHPAPKLTPTQVERALGALGIEGINRALGKGGEGITFGSDICRDGPGWRADVDLPLGVTAGMVAAKRDRLASGLRRPLGCVWPEGDAAVHEGRLVLWVGDRDLSKTMVSSPLLRAARHDVFRGAPFGSDPRGRPVMVPLVQHNVLIGSLPGNGKTAAVRVLASACALDPTVELHLHELKGTGDLDPLEQVSHRFVSGIDDETIEYAAESLKLLRAEVMRRTGAMKDLPRELVPDKRITREVADVRSHGLYPLACIIDECQNLFAHPVYGAAAGDDAEFIIKIGRAVGVILVLATQRPDKASLPTGVSGNVSMRFCLHVAGQTENDMVLGTSSYQNGVRATMFRPEIDAGIGYLKGATPAPIVARTAYLNQDATQKIAVRARALRAAAGTLTGHAAGEDAQVTLDVLTDVAQTLAPDETRVAGDMVLERLAAHRPAAYGDWSRDQLTAALKARGVSTSHQVNRKGEDGKKVNLRGVDRKEILDALSR